MFKQLFRIFVFVSIGHTSMGQFGISGQFSSYPVSAIESVVDASVFDINYGGAVDYWMRLKNYRWEMVPTFSYSRSLTSETSFNESSDISMQTAGFHFKNNIYILDFENDCNCPTFSKQSGWFKKSFFLQLSPGYSLKWIQVDNLTGGEKQNINLFELGLGAGFDFGISDLITISPYFNYVLTPRIEQDFLGSEPQKVETNYNHFLAGIRLGLRPDYARPNTVRRRNLRY